MAEKITKDLINRIINEIKKEENQQKIENEIFNPILIKFSKQAQRPKEGGVKKETNGGSASRPGFGS